MAARAEGKPRRKGSSGKPPPIPPRRFLLRLVLWAVPVTLVWLAITPAYNIFLVTAGENLLHLFESPDTTDLVREDAHRVGVLRRDFPPERSRVAGFRVTDLHFPLLLMGALFLAVPDVAWKDRLGHLGWASLISVFFHILLVVLWVQFLYATQLGEWSLEHYGPVSREIWGMAKHMADLPFKLALPLALWAFFYLERLVPRRAAQTT